jgi:hypothetical protein
VDVALLPLFRILLKQSEFVKKTPPHQQKYAIHYRHKRHDLEHETTKQESEEEENNSSQERCFNIPT